MREGESREDATWLPGSSCSPEQMGGQVQAQKKKAEKPGDVLRVISPQQDVDAGSQVAIRQNPSVL